MSSQIQMYKGVCVWVRCSHTPEQPMLSGISSLMALGGEQICFKTTAAFQKYQVWTKKRQKTEKKKNG